MGPETQKGLRNRHRNLYSLWGKSKSSQRYRGPKGHTKDSYSHGNRFKAPSAMASQRPPQVESLWSAT